MCVFGQMREGYGRAKCTKINGIGLIIHSILISRINLICAGRMLFHVAFSEFIHREDTVLTAGFDCHIGNGKSVIH